MKLNGFVGKGTGKLGSSVFAVSGGEQIVRQYNPNVSNPSTDAQVAQRAKLKLMSQLAAVFAPGLGFKKSGLISPRNKFIKANIGLATFTDGKATLPINNLVLSEGATQIGSITATRAQNNKLAVSLEAGYQDVVDKVVYVAVENTDDERLNLLGVQIADPGQNGTFAAEMKGSEFVVYVFAYGLKFNSASAKTRFDDYIASYENMNAFVQVVLPSSISSADTTATVNASLPSA